MPAMKNSIPSAGNLNGKIPVDYSSMKDRSQKNILTVPVF